MNANLIKEINESKKSDTFSQYKIVEEVKHTAIEDAMNVVQVINKVME